MIIRRRSYLFDFCKFALAVLMLSAVSRGAHNYVKTRGDIRCFRAQEPALCLCNPAKAVHRMQCA